MRTEALAVVDLLVTRTTGTPPRPPPRQHPTHHSMLFVSWRGCRGNAGVCAVAESQQWPCVAPRSREQLQRALAALQSDSRAELSDRAQELRRRIQSQP